MTARNKDCEDHQVGIGEQPSFRLFSGGFRGAHDGAQVLAARKAAKMIEADPGQSGDFFLSEDLLTRLDGDHFNPPSVRQLPSFGLCKKLQP